MWYHNAVDLLAMLDGEEGQGARLETPPVGRETPRGGRARYQSRDRLRPLKVTVTPAEKAVIEARAQEAGLSVASFLRAAAISRQVKSVFDHQVVGELVKVAGDQGRLGGLLKLWLTDQPGRGVPEIEVRRLLERINALQDQLADVVSKV